MLSAAWAADGHTIAVGDANGNIHLLTDAYCSCIDYYSGFPGHKGRINAISWSPSNTDFATAGDDGTIQTWSIVNSQQTRSNFGIHIQTYPDPGRSKLLTVAWSPDGQSLLAGEDAGTVLFWQV